MSFSSEAKMAAAIMPKSHKEQKAMLYGMLLFGNVFSESDIMLMTETAEVSDILCGLLLGVCDIMASPQAYEKGGREVYKIKIDDKSDLSRLYEEFGAAGIDAIDKSIITDAHTETAFLRGVFLSCGYINPPEKSYRLDFTVRSGDLAVDLAVVLMKCVGEMPKLSVRRSNQIVYFRDSNLIVDFMNMIGLTSQAFEIMNSQIERDIRNNLNRRTNFDVANIGKKTAASVTQIEAINAIIDRGDFEKLPVNLRQTARLRLDMPDASLEALGKAEVPPISKSQVSKRLSQIVEMSKNK